MLASALLELWAGLLCALLALLASSHSARNGPGASSPSTAGTGTRLAWAVSWAALAGGPSPVQLTERVSSPVEAPTLPGPLGCQLGTAGGSLGGRHRGPGDTRCASALAPRCGHCAHGSSGRVLVVRVSVQVDVARDQRVGAGLGHPFLSGRTAQFACTLGVPWSVPQPLDPPRSAPQPWAEGGGRASWALQPQGRMGVVSLRRAVKHACWAQTPP